MSGLFLRFLTLFITLLVFSLGANAFRHDMGMGQDGNGGEVYFSDGTFRLVDFNSSYRPTCQWVRMELFFDANSQFEALIDQLYQKHPLLADLFQRDLKKLSVCRTENLKPLIDSDLHIEAASPNVKRALELANDGISLIEKKDAQFVAIRFGDKVYLDDPIYQKMDADEQVKLWYHEFVHSIIPSQKGQRYYRKVASFVKWTYQLVNSEMSTSEFIFQLKMEQIDLPYLNRYNYRHIRDLFLFEEKNFEEQKRFLRESVHPSAFFEKRENYSSEIQSVYPILKKSTIDFLSPVVDQACRKGDASFIKWLFDLDVFFAESFSPSCWEVIFESSKKENYVEREALLNYLKDKFDLVLKDNYLSLLQTACRNDFDPFVRFFLDNQKTIFLDIDSESGGMKDLDSDYLYYKREDRKIQRSVVYYCYTAIFENLEQTPRVNEYLFQQGDLLNEVDIIFETLRKIPFYDSRRKLLSVDVWSWVFSEENPDIVFLSHLFVWAVKSSWWDIVKSRFLAPMEEIFEGFLTERTAGSSYQIIQQANLVLQEGSQKRRERILGKYNVFMKNIFTNIDQSERQKLRAALSERDFVRRYRNELLTF